MAQSSEVSAGDQGLASQYNSLRDDALGAVLTNKSGAERSAGEIVVQDTSSDSAFTTTTAEADEKVIGVVAETIANDAAGLVQRTGTCAVNVDGATSRGDWLVTSATAGKATPKAAFQTGVFAVALTASAGAGSVTCVLLMGALPDVWAHASRHDAGGADALSTVPDHDHTGDAGDGGYLRVEEYVCVRDKKAQNTDGGTFTSGAWRTRDINEEVADTGGLCSISSNQITLAAGTYRCCISAPAKKVGVHQARLQNVTDGTTLLMGTSEWAVDANDGYNRSFIVGRFTLAAQKTLEVQHQCSDTRAVDGFGYACNFGDEIYTVAEFWREAG